MNQVVITGMGVVSPVGIGLDPFWTSLKEGRIGVRTRNEFAETNLRFKLAAEVADFDGKQFVKPRKALKVMCRPIQLGFAAAKMAFENAELNGQFDPDRFSVMIGTESFYSEPNEVARVFRKCVENQVYHHGHWGEHSMREIEPLWMLKYLPNMVASHISIALDARGPSNTICQSEASSSLAVIEGYNLIQRGVADVVMAGGTGSPIAVTGAVYRGDQFLSNRIEDPESACRPFDKDRDGMVLGEGSGCLILEDRSHAESRGAKILGEIKGYARSYCSPQSDEFDLCVEHVIRDSIKNSGLSPNEIGHLNATGYSTVSDDINEAVGIAKALGEIPVIAPKSIMGNIGPASGTVELIATLLALLNGQLPRIANCDQLDSNCPINVVTSDQAISSEHGISINHSLTGQATSIVIKSCI